MYEGSKVLDGHGHVSAPSGMFNHAAAMMASNTARPSPLAFIPKLANALRAAPRLAKKLAG